MHPEAENNEAVLIENIKQGQRSSFDSLVRLYRQSGLNIAYNLVGNLEDARDVLQEALMKVYLHIQGFQQKSKFSTWFYRIVTNCAIDFLRKQKRSRRVFVEFQPEEEEEREIQIPDSRFAPNEILANQELNHLIEAGLARLSEKQRLCFVLKHQSGLEIKEISEIVKCNPATVKVHLFRAMESLREELAKYLVK